jgi:uncharacterized membrane protein
MMDGWNMTGWGWSWMSLITVVGIVLIALVARTVMRDSGSRSVRAEEDPALTVLRRRLASGEIDEDDFNRRQVALERKSEEKGA